MRQEQNRCCLLPHRTALERVSYQSLIHLLYILERTVAETYDIRMIEMRIGCKNSSL